MANQKPAFELGFRNGSWIKIYADGTVTGVQSDTVIINRIPYLLGFQRGREADVGEVGDSPVLRMNPKVAPLI